MLVAAPWRSLSTRERIWSVDFLDSALWLPRSFRGIGSRRSSTPRNSPSTTAGSFKFDLENAGIEGGWAAPDFDDSKWQRVSAGQSWTDFGYFNYSGVAWYRKNDRHSRTIPREVPRLPRRQGPMHRVSRRRRAGAIRPFGRSEDARAVFGHSAVPPASAQRCRPSQIALRVEGTDTHAYDTPGPGLVASVALSDSILVFHEGYWLAPDEYRDAQGVAGRNARGAGTAAGAISA